MSNMLLRHGNNHTRTHEETYQGEQLAIDKTVNDKVYGLEILGKSVQSGTPTPAGPIPINSSANFDLSITGGQPINYPITLRGIPNGSGGWSVQDKATNDVGKIIRPIAYRGFTGTEYWVQEVAYSDRIMYHTLGFLTDASSMTAGAKLLCTHLLQTTIYGAIGAAYTTASNFLRFTYPITIAPDVATFKNWLAAQYAAGTPVTVQYQLATPTEEAITKQTIATTQYLTELSTNATIKPDIKATVKILGN